MTGQQREVYKKDKSTDQYLLKPYHVLAHVPSNVKPFLATGKAEATPINTVSTAVTDADRRVPVGSA